MGRSYHNLVPSPPGQGYLAPPEHVKREFAKRLQIAMNEKGLSQSDLARIATDRLPKGTKGKISRDLVSCYVRARHVPRPHYLQAICDVLGKEPADLLPAGATPSADADTAPAVRTEQLENGKTWLRINAVLEWETALKVMSLVNEDQERKKTRPKGK